MLILSRRCEDEIVIDDQVTIKVISVSGGRVKLGVSAPPEVPIRRCEQLDGQTPDCTSLDCGPVLVLEPEPLAS